MYIGVPPEAKYHQMCGIYYNHANSYPINQSVTIGSSLILSDYHWGSGTRQEIRVGSAGGNWQLGGDHISGAGIYSNDLINVALNPFIFYSSRLYLHN